MKETQLLKTGFFEMDGLGRCSPCIPPAFFPVDSRVCNALSCLPRGGGWAWGPSVYNIHCRNRMWDWPYWAARVL